MRLDSKPAIVNSRSFWAMYGVHTTETSAAKPAGNVPEMFQQPRLLDSVSKIEKILASASLAS